MRNYDPKLEECMGCTSERCRGGCYVKVPTFAGERIICKICAEAVIAAVEARLESNKDDNSPS